MMGHRGKMSSADERDALAKTHRLLSWRPGQRRIIKRQYNKRQRRDARMALGFWY
jgi:hypothetical protein